MGPRVSNFCSHMSKTVLEEKCLPYQSEYFTNISSLKGGFMGDEEVGEDAPDGLRAKAGVTGRGYHRQIGGDRAV